MLCNLSYKIVVYYSNSTALNNLGIISFSSEIPIQSRKLLLRMKDVIKLKRLWFAVEIGVALKSTSKKIDVTSIKLKFDKLKDIKFEPIDKTEINSRRRNRQNPVSSKLKTTLILTIFHFNSFISLLFIFYFQ